MLPAKLPPIMTHPSIKKKVVLIGHRNGTAGLFCVIHNAARCHLVSFAACKWLTVQRANIKIDAPNFSNFAFWFFISRLG
jgi:hypothetical protein